MIALDTNVLVRYLADDDPVQSPIAGRIVEETVEKDDLLFLSEVVIVETVWVLARAYHKSRQEIANVLDHILRARHFEFRDEPLLARAIRAYTAGKADFADYLIRELSLDAGCDYLVTFDRSLWKDDHVRKAK